MNVEMVPVQVVGMKADLQVVLHALRHLGCIQIESLVDTPEISARPLALDRETLSANEERSFLLARLEGLLEALSIQKVPVGELELEADLVTIRSSLDQILPEIQALTARREKLQAEQAALPRYETTLRKLLPIIPASAHRAGYVTIGVLVSRAHMGVLDLVGKRILELTGGRAEVVANDVDLATRAMLIVFPGEFTSEIESLLGREDVSRLRLPTELGEGPPDVILAALHRRMTGIPEELKQIERRISELAVLWEERLLHWRDILRDEIEAYSVLSQFGETDMTFVLAGWVPAPKFESMKAALERDTGPAILVQGLPLTAEMKKRAPIILKNPTPSRPFESLVNLLAIPRYDHTDPTLLMAFFMPIFFGMILGDVGYGAILLGISLICWRKFPKGVLRDVVAVLAMGAGWSIVFGFLFGEFFGTLGEQLGMQALWFERASPEHVAGLLIMALAVGAVHVTLGLVLGVWEAARDRSRTHLLERGGMLLGLISLFFLIGILANFLPRTLMTAAISGIIVGIALLGASLGWLGILMGPIEFISLIGNVLSYLRIAAIGLASVYLAKVANDLAGMVGNLIVGILIAVLIHSLNLVMGAFSPTIHSLRLHYVEFFRKFYEGGGRPYRPYRHNLPQTHV